VDFDNRKSFFSDHLIDRCIFTAISLEEWNKTRIFLPRAYCILFFKTFFYVVPFLWHQLFIGECKSFALHKKSLLYFFFYFLCARSAAQDVRSPGNNWNCWLYRTAHLSAEWNAKDAEITDAHAWPISSIFTASARSAISSYVHRADNDVLCLLTLPLI